MATLKEVYDLLKQKQKDGEDIGMFGESYLRMIEVEKSSNTKIRKLWPFYLIYAILTSARMYRFILFNRQDCKLTRKYMFWTYNMTAIFFVILYAV